MLVSPITQLAIYCTKSIVILSSQSTDARDKYNQTPLHFACKGLVSKELIQYLVEELKCDVGEFKCKAHYQIPVLIIF